jgi:hypothetical protein
MRHTTTPGLAWRTVFPQTADLHKQEIEAGCETEAHYLLFLHDIKNEMPVTSQYNG